MIRQKLSINSSDFSILGGRKASAILRYRFWHLSLLVVVGGLSLFLCSTSYIYAWTDTEIADAIFLAEGKERATFLYGIRSVSYADEKDARRICLNTIRNCRRRYAKYGYKDYPDFLSFLASRYAPLNCDNDPKGLNRFWLKNVLYSLEKNKCQ